MQKHNSQTVHILRDSFSHRCLKQGNYVLNTALLKGFKNIEGLIRQPISPEIGNVHQGRKSYAINITMVKEINEGIRILCAKLDEEFEKCYDVSQRLVRYPEVAANLTKTVEHIGMLKDTKFVIQQATLFSEGWIDGNEFHQFTTRIAGEDRILLNGTCYPAMNFRRIDRNFVARSFKSGNEDIPLLKVTLPTDTDLKLYAENSYEFYTKCEIGSRMDYEGICLKSGDKEKSSKGKFFFF